MAAIIVFFVWDLFWRPPENDSFKDSLESAVGFLRPLRRIAVVRYCKIVVRTSFLRTMASRIMPKESRARLHSSILPTLAMSSQITCYELQNAQTTSMNPHWTQTDVKRYWCCRHWWSFFSLSDPFMLIGSFLVSLWRTSSIVGQFLLAMLGWFNILFNLGQLLYFLMIPIIFPCSLRSFFFAFMFIYFVQFWSFLVYCMVIGTSPHSRHFWSFLFVISKDGCPDGLIFFCPVTHFLHLGIFFWNFGSFLSLWENILLS